MALVEFRAWADIARAGYTTAAAIAGTALGLHAMARKRKSYAGRPRGPRGRFKRRRYKNRIYSRYSKRPKHELKLHDQNLNSTFHAAGSSGIHFTNILQGLDNINRIGDKICVKSIAFRITMKQHILSTQTHDQVRCAFIVDRQQTADAASLVMANVYVEEFNPLSFLSQNSFGRYGVLWTRTYFLSGSNPAVTNGQGNSGRLIKGILKFKKPLCIRYNGPNSNDIQKNGLHWVVQSTGQTGFQTAVDVKIRVRFFDP